MSARVEAMRVRMVCGRVEAMRVRMVCARLWPAGLLAVGALLVLGGVGAQARVAHRLAGSFAGGETPAGSMTPWSLAAAANGDVYVADVENNVVDVFEEASGEYVYMRQLTGTPPSAPVSGAFGSVKGVAVDPSDGAVLVADYELGVVDVFNTTGEYLTQIGGSETPGGSMSPWAVAAGPSGTVYVADLGSGAVDEFEANASGGYTYVRQLTGTPPSAPVSGGFGFVTSLAVDPSNGNVYVGDFANGVVDEFDPSGGFVSQLSGGATPAGSFGMRGLAVEAGTHELYVGDIANSVVDAFEASGVFGEAFAGPAPFAPFGVAVGASGAVLVGNVETSSVEVFTRVTLPDVSMTAPSGVQGTTATLNGTVNPDGLPVSACRFEYIDEAGYQAAVAAHAADPYAEGASAQCSPIGSGTAPVTVQAGVVGLVPHTTYHYRLLVENQYGSSASSDATLTSALVTPVVDAAPARAVSIGQSSATLQGTVNPRNAQASWHFVYGTTSAYGSIAPQPDSYVALNDEDDAVSQAITGLLPGTTYHFALVASSPGGSEVTGPDETFTTQSVPAPSVLTGGASSAGERTVTLSGSVDPHGWETSYLFQYGTTSAYGQQWPTLPITLGALSGAQQISIYLEGLQPETLYHYRLLATNEGGTTYGPDQTFTTGGYPPSTIQEITPLTSQTTEHQLTPHTPHGHAHKKPKQQSTKHKPKHTKQKNKHHRKT